MMNINLRIFRFNPENDKEPHYEDYTVDAEPNNRILDCLNKIRWEQDPSLSYRWSCSHGICGSDGMTINGVASLACQRLVEEFSDSDYILIEPLGFFPIIKDLVVDWEPFFERMRSIHPETWGGITPPEVVKELEQTREERGEIEDAIKCILCCCCTASCPVNLEEEPEFIGPAASLRAQRYIFDSRLKDTEDRLDIADKPHGIWSCKTYYKCTEVCPKGIKVTQAILQTKDKLMEKSFESTKD
jgi:succinate dehydrogenase / fumarate reductase iron-sulfur subunit